MNLLTKVFGCICLCAVGASCGGGTNAGNDAGNDAGSDAGAGGPFGTGPQRAIAPSGTGSTSQPHHFGQNISLVLDEQNDPALAYVYVDPNGDGDASDSAVFFTAWDRTHGAFTTPVMVGVVGVQANAGSAEPISLAYDASTHTFGLAYQTTLTTPPATARGLAIATSSDRGVTWSSNPAVDAAAGGATAFPSLAMGGGNGYLVYVSDPISVKYLTGPETAAATTWTASQPPLPTGSMYYRWGVRAGVALDSTGAPGVAFFARGGTPSIALSFWRPGSPTSSIVAQSSNDNSIGDVFLGFAGTAPRIVAHIQPVEPATQSADARYWSFNSADGSVWTMANVPLDPGAGPGLAFTAGFAPQGHSALMYVSNSGSGTATCGSPKLSRSADNAAWTTCSPDTDGSLHLVPNPTSVSLAFGSDDGLVLAFSNEQSATNGLPVGILVWRQP